MVNLLWKQSQILKLRECCWPRRSGAIGPYTSCLTHKSNAQPVCSNVIFILLVTVEFSAGHITLLKAFEADCHHGNLANVLLMRGFGGPVHIIQHQCGRQWCGKNEHSCFIPRSFTKTETTVALKVCFKFYAYTKNLRHWHCSIRNKQKRKTPELSLSSLRNNFHHFGISFDLFAPRFLAGPQRSTLSSQRSCHNERGGPRRSVWLEGQTSATHSDTLE